MGPELLHMPAFPIWVPGYFYNVANQHPKRKAFVMFHLVNISQVKTAHSASWTQQRGALALVSPSCSVCAAP